MVDILGSRSEIRIAWRCKPELRCRMVRYMMEHCGHPGVRALARALTVSYAQVYEAGCLEGRLKRRACQRRQRQKRQRNKLAEYTLEAKFANDTALSGGGKRGKGGGLQSIGKNAIMQSIKGQ